MYKIKDNKYKELLNGRSVEWLATELGYNVTTLYLIFNGHKHCKKALAFAIVKALDITNEVDDYFEKIR